MKSRIPQYYQSTEGVEKNAKILRKPLTPAEDRFWQMVRNRKVLGLKFRRQHPINRYVADFYCHELKLVVEIDGAIHKLEKIKEYDAEREAAIRTFGLEVLRFTNDEVFTNPHLIEMAVKRRHSDLNSGINSCDLNPYSSPKRRRE